MPSFDAWNDMKVDEGVPFDLDDSKEILPGGITAKDILFQQLFDITNHHYFYLPNGLVKKTFSENLNTLDIEPLKQVSEKLFCKWRFWKSFKQISDVEREQFIRTYPEDAFMDENQRLGAQISVLKKFELLESKEAAENEVLQTQCKIWSFRENIDDQLDVILESMSSAKWLEKLRFFGEKFGFQVEDDLVRIVKYYKLATFILFMKNSTRMRCFQPDKLENFKLFCKEMIELSKEKYPDWKVTEGLQLQFNALFRQLDDVLEVQLKRFNSNEKSFNVLYDILAIYYTKGKFKEFEIFLQENYDDIVRLGKESVLLHLLIEVLERVWSRLVDQGLKDRLEKDFLNELNKRRNPRATFVTQTAQAKHLMLEDGSGSTICLVCWDVVSKDELVIWCRNCDKYVGHANCLGKWLQNNPSCPQCRKSR
jgi:hypothetical protein